MIAASAEQRNGRVNGGSESNCGGGRGVTRRSALAAVGVAAAFGLAPGVARGLAPRRWPRRTRFAGFDERHLTVRQAGRTEELQASFRLDGGRAYKPGVDALSWLFRDWRDGDVGRAIDIRLFDKLALIQTLLSTLEDRPATLILYSGYRTPTRNRTLEGAAVNSQHIHGRAADITVDGVSNEVVAKTAELAAAHGLGRYPIFTHIDVGPRGRRWIG